jgi:hypothetical protein
MSPYNLKNNRKDAKAQNFLIVFFASSRLSVEKNKIINNPDSGLICCFYRAPIEVWPIPGGFV